MFRIFNIFFTLCDTLFGSIRLIYVVNHILNKGAKLNMLLLLVGMPPRIGEGASTEMRIKLLLSITYRAGPTIFLTLNSLQH
jgi:hypothetical protein